MLFSVYTTYGGICCAMHTDSLEGYISIYPPNASSCFFRREMLQEQLAWLCYIVVFICPDGVNVSICL